MNKETKAIVVLHGSKEYKKLDKDLNGLLEKAWAKSDEKEVNISYASDKYDFITIVKETATTAQEWRNFGGKYYKQHASATSITFDIDHKNVKDIVEGVRLAEYSFTKYKTKEDKTPPSVSFTKDSMGEIWQSVYFARDLVTEPGNVLYPEEYAQRIYETLTPLGVVVKIIPQKMLERMGFDLLLSVGQGSVRDSQVVIMEWMNGSIEQLPTALVGKGVTFDTGGISIKPSAGMGDMKYDMGGSAAVVGAIHAIASQKLKRNVVGIVGLVENMPDGNSVKPGDVVTSLSGMTVENLNTDAEGRLVLADILTHVQRTYDPKIIIDLATLTGAIVAALGNDIAGLFTNSSELSNTIDAVGSASGESFWRMPMGPDWNKMLDSQIADVKNISGGRYGGATTAAEFLYRFVDNHRAWAHLDIAGTVWSESGKPTSPKGAVGFGVRTLFNFVKDESDRLYEIDEDMNY